LWITWRTRNGRVCVTRPQHWTHFGITDAIPSFWGTHKGGLGAASFVPGLKVPKA